MTKVKKHPPVAELKLRILCQENKFNIFNFSSATRGHFSTLSQLFSSMDPLSKRDVVPRGRLLPLGSVEIVDSLSINRNFKQNVKEGHFLGFIHS